LYHSSINIQSATSVDVPGFGEPRKSACVVFYLCLLSVQYAQQRITEGELKRRDILISFHLAGEGEYVPVQTWPSV